ncbi:MAG: hypothetical protein OHK0022_23650 [Roseiflexaceae bacterium]
MGMEFQRASFVVRIKSTASLQEIGERVGKLLNCQFVLSNDKSFEGLEALEAKLLGLWLTIGYSRRLIQNERRTYQLTGDIDHNLKASHGGIRRHKQLYLGHINLEK